MNPTVSRLAAVLALGLAATLPCGCAGPKPAAAAAATGPSAASASSAPAVAAVPSGPASAPVARAGQPGAVALDPRHRRELDAALGKLPKSERPRLRYALASGDDGKRHLVVYDGQGLGPDGRDPARPQEYVVFKVLNSASGEHYDPQQNSVVAPIPPPRERDGSVTAQQPPN